MAFDFICPYCHAKFVVEESFRGKTGPCAECDKLITMPGRQAASQIEAYSQAQQQTKKRRQVIANTTRVAVLLLSITTLIIVCFLIFNLVMPELRIAKAKRDIILTSANLRRVASALNAYAAKYGSYPPPTVSDKNGVALYSWRVLILPQLGYKELYNSFDLNAGWDNPENLYISKQMPAEFKNYDLNNVLYESETSVALIIGPATLFPSTGSLAPVQCVDNPALTILVTEGLRSNNNWTAPFDIPFTGAMKVGMSNSCDIGIGRASAAAATVAETDLIIPATQPHPALRALVTPNGGETLDPNLYKLENFGQNQRQEN